MARIVVCGYAVRNPVAGNALAHLQYVVGLVRLGHEVFYLEESGWPGSCHDVASGRWNDDPRAGLAATRSLLHACGAAAPVCYVDRASGATFGAEWAEAKRALAAAELLLNVGGVCWLPEFRSCRRRALIDMDPLFTQLGRIGAEGLHEHDVHWSYGLNLGRPGCGVPSLGLDWRPTCPPVVPELWEPRAGPVAEADAPAPRALTTIASWSAYGAVFHAGERYGQKDEEFLRLLELPSRTRRPLELALSGAGPEIEARLRAAGWVVRDGVRISRDAETYRAYVTRSRGELSVAKHGYVRTRSGWFSDRSACYLAAGRPVIVQDTGFGEWLGAEAGVLTFSTLDEAAERIERLDADYERHARGARDVAARAFDYRVVLPRLVERSLR